MICDVTSCSYGELESDPLFQIILGWEIPHQTEHHGKHDDSIEEVKVLVPLVWRDPTREHDCKHGRKQWNEEKKKSDMKTCHHRSEQKKQEFVQLPDKFEHDLDGNKAQQETQEYFPRRAFERHRSPLGNVRYAERKFRRDLERVSCCLSSERRQR